MRNRFALLVQCAILLLTAVASAAVAADRELLTPAERAWLADHPDIVLGAGQEWAPAVVRDAHGQFPGFAFDHLDLLNAKLGTRFRLKAGPWHTLVEEAEARQIAGLTLTLPLAARQAHFFFTRPYHAVQYFISNWKNCWGCGSNLFRISPGRPPGNSWRTAALTCCLPWR